MMRLSLLVVFTLAHSIAISATAQDAPKAVEPTNTERETQLAERDRLWEQASKLSSEGKTRDAITAGEKVLALEIQLFGPSSEELTGTLESLSNWQLATGNMDAAADHANQLYTISDEDFNAVAEARLSKASAQRLQIIRDGNRRFVFLKIAGTCLPKKQGCAFCGVRLVFRNHGWRRRTTV